MADIAKILMDRDEKNRSGRSNFETLWKDIENHVLPDRGSFKEEVTQGQERTRHILDSTAPRALELFAAQLHSLLNNPSSQWFRIRILNADGNREVDLEQDSQLKDWSEKVEKIMLQEFESESVDLNAQLHTLYLDLGAFGTGVLYLDANPDGILRSREYHLRDVTFNEDAFGNVIQVYRAFKLTPAQARQQWPDKDDGEIGRTLENFAEGKENPDREMEFMHVIVPMDGSEPEIEKELPKKVKKTNRPFASLWINKTDRKIVATGAYHEMPYMIPRWIQARGEIYGRSPAMKVLPDIRMANRMKETILRGAEKLVDPPLMIPDGGLISPVRMFPGGLTFTEGSVQPQPVIPTGASRIDVGDALLQDTQQSIRDGFFVSLFMTQESPVKTATQVLQETDERNRALSPMLIRTQSELFHPLIERAFGLMMRGGRLPEPPRDDIQIKAEFISPLNSSQKEQEALGTQRLMEGLIPWANFDPTVLDQFNPDMVAKAMHAGSGSPDSILRSERAVKNIREARNQEEQRQQQFEQVTEAVDVAANASQSMQRGR